MPRKLILDVDTGTDDAVAIMLAALHPELELLAVSQLRDHGLMHSHNRINVDLDQHTPSSHRCSFRLLVT